MYFCAILALVIGGGHCAKILGVFMYPAISHQVIYTRICKELSLRGHRVTLVTPIPLKDPTLTNLTEVNVDFIKGLLSKTTSQEKFSKENSAKQVLTNVYHVVNQVAELELNSTQFRTILNKNQNFDLVLVDFFNPVIFGLAARYQAPVISIAPSDVMSTNYDAVGNPNHPILYPDKLLIYQKRKLTLWEKIKNVYFLLWQKYYHNLVYMPRTQEMAEKYFGKMPYVGDLVKKGTMLFVYRNIVLEPAKPMVPTVIDISFINSDKPLKPLPEDLQKILDRATEGAIYVSFGSRVKTVLFENFLKTAIAKALSELPYKILLKWDSDDFPSYPNIVVRKWFPQRDLLAHPNIKVFVTQGGVQSIEEAILAEVPLVGVPFVTDQPRNVRNLVDLGIGEGIDPNDIDKTKFKNLIIKVAQTVAYKEKIKEARNIVLDKKMTGLESAVWWCEYVIRHKGAKYLRNSSVNMSYFDYFLTDVILFPVFILILSLLILLKLIQK